ncbi:hypothetical protein JCGZ_06277 [Jatropha curcas]|uniref:Regulator of Vps4 activity in the MVB pathway protein n=3 Tax=Jatropha curcas TaxID=180498 RepID=A0A067KLY6_JATCU|nr:hypothetical protein JCGZ_06277 [Jatropha curcas]
MTKTRLEALKNKKSSVIKFLRKDMADLLKNDLDYNAYCRAEGLLVEQRMRACYNFIEQFSACISSHISIMNKQKECPEECKEAVQSLIYAAARIAEFPELRDLRSLFTERYGNSLEPYTNKEFAEMLRPTSASKEMKLQLMHEIAEEFSIEWNSKSLEQKLFKPPSTQEDQHRPKNKDDIVVPKADCPDVDLVKRDSHETENKVNVMKLENFFLSNPEKEIASSGEKRNVIDERYNQPTSSEDEINSVHRRNNSDLDSRQASSSSVGSVSEDEVESKKPLYYKFVPPPYVKQNVEKEAGKIEEPAKPTGHTDDSVNDAKPKPRSVRRRHLQPPPGHENLGNDAKTPVKQFSGHENVDSAEPGGLAKTNAWAEKEEQTNVVNQRDEKDYSKDKVKPTQKTIHDSYKASGRRNKSSELPLPPGREAIKKASKRHNRAISLLQEALTGHVHPNLPDYDDIAARFAAMKGR